MRRVRLIALTALIVMGNAYFPHQALAADKPPSVKINSKQKELDRIQSELERKKKEQELLEKEAEELTRTLTQEKGKIQEIEKSLAFTLKRNLEVQNQLAETKMDLDQTVTQAQKEKKAFESLAREFYLASALSGPAAPNSVYGGAALTNQAQKLNDLNMAREETRKALGSLMETSQVFKAEVFRQKGEIGDLQSAVVNQRERLKKNLTKREVIERDLINLEKTSRELAGLIDLLRQKQEQEQKAEEAARQRKILEGKSPISAGSLLWPLEGSVVQAFGRQKHPDFGTPFISNGIKISARGSQPAKVVDPGVVLYVGNFMSYGPMVLVEHKGDWYSVYGNLGRWGVEKGQVLKRGDVIGWTEVDESGSSLLYFELRFYGKPTDPAPWLQKL